jgi:wyosine [tRNA(Phe)-imidazoG37] synthetase (radical SAM superfamily)
MLGHGCAMDNIDRELPCDRGCAYGPVPSRRLGESLGVNTVPPKTCTYSCIYCQLGRTNRLSVDRKAYYNTRTVVKEVNERLVNLKVKPDYVTFLGYGEPTLASNMGEILGGISETSICKKALLTNGALLWMPEVRKEALDFDVVLPTVAAGSERVFRRIHRPHPSLSCEKVLGGIRKFSEEFPGEIWVEVMLVRGVNDDRSSLEDIAKVLEGIEPDKVHLTAPTRPPSEKWVKCPTKEAVELALATIPASSATMEPEAGEFGFIEDSVVEDLLAMAAVHPMREEQVLGVLVDAGYSKDKAIDILDGLVESSTMSKTEHLGEVFYRTRR